MRVAPFRALRYDRSVAGPEVETSAPAYDELDRFRYAHHRTSNPYTVLQLIAEVEGPRTTPGVDGAFASARTTLDRWQRTGILTLDPEPAVYLYEEHEVRLGLPVVQRGIVATIALDDVDEGALLLHEHVEESRAAARARRLEAVPLDLTPVVAVHIGGAGAGLAKSVGSAHATVPLAAFSDEGGIDHRLWRIADRHVIAEVVAAYRGVPAVLADGHHRVEAARRLRKSRGPGAGRDQTLTWLVDAEADGPELRAVHRLVDGAVPRDGDGVPQLPGFHGLAWHAGAAGLPRAVAERPGLCFGLVTAADAWLLRAEDPDALRAAAAYGLGALLGNLDAQVLSSVVLPAMGGGAPRPVIDAEQGAADVRRAGRGSLLVLAPPAIAQVIAIARAGQRMPAKTTWFRPKPRAGLIMRRFDTDDASPPCGTVPP